MNKKPGVIKRMIKRMFTRRPGRRGFDAAKMSRIVADWVKSSTSLDEDIKSGLTTLRARSRDICQNQDYGRRFLKLLGANVVGPAGIRLSSKVKRFTDGQATDTLDAVANLKIEAAWLNWCKKENCTVTGKLSFIDVQRLFIQGMARDGEALVRLAQGFDNPFGFSLQLIEPDYLDHEYTDDHKNIKMAVERNKWKKPIAYHISRHNPLEYTANVTFDRQRISAAEIIHEFITERSEQTRGFPWTASALKRLHHVGHYEQSELVAARAGASKMGFFTSPQMSSLPGDDTDDKGNLIEEISAGKLQQLPLGYDFKPFDIDHPNSGFDGFVKAMLRGAAAGLDVSYSSLSNDLAEANYSSLRQGALSERDAWMVLQGFMIEHFCIPVFTAWLPWAIINGQLSLPISKVDQWLAGAKWQPRRWAWIDPLKDTTSNEKAVALGINSRSRIAAEQGADIEDVFADLKRENDQAAKLAISISQPTTAKGPDK